MKLPKLFKPKQQPIINTWTYQPYGFEPGQRYVIEINRNWIDLPEIKKLHDYFEEQGIICKLVLTSTGNALQPIQVKTMMRED